MAKNFKKITKTDPLRSPNVNNTNRKGFIKVAEKKGRCEIKYTTPTLFFSEILNNNTLKCVNSCLTRAILQCNVSLDGNKSLKGVILCPCRGNVLRTLLFKFGVEKFNVAKVDVIKSVGEAQKN